YRHFGLAVRAGGAGPIVVEVDIHPGQRRHVRRESTPRGKNEIGPVTFLVALAAYPAHDPVADLDPFALLEIVDLRHGSSVLRPLDLEPAGLAIPHDLAGLAQGGGSQGEVRAPADPIQLADIDAVVPVLDRDDRPFEGTVVAVEDGYYRINIGKLYRISRGTDLTLTAATLGEAGKVVRYRETGRLKVKRAEDAGSVAEVDDLKKGEGIKIGDRVVRRVRREGDEERDRTYFILATKGGLAPDVAPLPRVNVYLNNDWAGSTGADGKAEVSLRLGKSYDLLLYRH